MRIATLQSGRARCFGISLRYRSIRSEGGSVREESRTDQEDLNWNAILGMMALMLVSFGLYGAAVGTYFTLTS
jgi:hypothetical protein